MAAFSDTKREQSADLTVKTWKMKHFQSCFKPNPDFYSKRQEHVTTDFGLKPELCRGKHKAAGEFRPNCDSHGSDTDRWTDRQTVQSGRPTGRVIGRKETDGFGASACPTTDSTDAFFKGDSVKHTDSWELLEMRTDEGGEKKKVPSIWTICLSVSHHVTDRHSDERRSNHPTENTSSGTALWTLLSLGTVCVQRLGFEGSRGFSVRTRGGWPRLARFHYNYSP